MKKIVVLLLLFSLFSNCAQKQTIAGKSIPDGFYGVIAFDTLPPATKPTEALISFDTLFNPGDHTRVLIDTRDFVPLELEVAPVTTPDEKYRKLPSITLTQPAAEKMRVFSAERVMKHVAIVLDGKAITAHMIREAITGDHVQITRCNDNACEYLYTRLMGNVVK